MRITRAIVTAAVGCAVAGLLAAVPQTSPRVAPAALASAGVTAVPRYDHIVVVVDENHRREQVIGNPDAPWINQLAANGANLTSSYGVTHPSQPNYLALFAGSTLGLTDDSCPHTYTDPNLATQLTDAGLSFTGYSESLPSAGWTGCAMNGYARKHNPWVDFPAVPASANQPFTAFPSDYSTLPTVSFVIPNLTNDMHDGTIATGDTWLANNLDGYVRWARTHNSLFVLTFDEDDFTAVNRIPTVVAGAQVRPGDYADQVNHYTMLRTIEDSLGLPPLGQAATSAPLLSIFAAPGDDQRPTASFTVACGTASCTFDGSASSDPDGSVAAWAWDFGDGTTGTGRVVTHAFTEAGQYTVGLSVTDDQGAAGSTARQIDGNGTLAVDTFNRTVATGLGTADRGGSWTVTSAAASSVSPGAGTLRLTKAGSQVGAVLGGVARTDVEVLGRVALSAVPVGGPMYVTVHGRRVSSGNEYDARLLVNADRSVTLRLSRFAGGVETTIAAPFRLPGLAYAAGTQLMVRLQVAGTAPTAVRARAWVAGSAEPTTWQVTAADGTAALQGAGAIGVTGYLSSAATNAPIALAVGEFRARPATAPANVVPVAAFTSSCRQLTCDLDASTSRDPDGTIVRRSWDFGDGAVGDGVAVSHAYVVAGDYRVTLTVTDDSGATASTSATVTATTPPLNQPPTARFTATCTGRTCTFDGNGSTDDEGVQVWTWDFGDGASGTGPTVSHTYVDGGTYAVRMTVADEYDATDTATQSLVVTTSFVRDTFGRVVDNGFGTADVGGAWTVAGGAASSYSVRPGYASMRLAAAGTQTSAVLAATKRAAADVRAALRLSAVPVGGPVYLTVIGRRVSAGNDYAARLFVNADGSVQLRVARFVGNVETGLAATYTLPGVTYQAALQLNVRLQVTGSGTTTVRAKAWPITVGEPAGWQVTGTDSTAALQAPGYVGAIAYLSSRLTNAPLTAELTSLVADTP